MTFELWSLLAAVVLGLVYLSAAAFSFKAQAGNAYTVGPRDKRIEPVGVAARLSRAHGNFRETFAYFAALILAAHVVEAHGIWSTWGSALYLAGRALYLPLYAAGVPWLRSFAWNAATLGVVLVGVQIVAIGTATT